MILVGVLFLMCIKHGMPGWLTVKIGGLQTEDFRRLTPEHQKSLQKQTFRCFPLAIAITFVPGLGFSFLNIQVNTVAVFIGFIIQLIVIAVITTPLFDIAKSIKTELDMTNGSDK